jgi:hypothetical protein
MVSWYLIERACFSLILAEATTDRQKRDLGFVDTLAEARGGLIDSAR